MKICEKYDRMLWLDVYGELAHEERACLRQHTDACAICRKNAVQLHTLIEAVRKSDPVPALSDWESRNLTHRILHSLKKEKRETLRFFRLSFVPMLAAASLIVFFTGWFGLGQWHQPPADMLKAEEIQIIRNYEMISNLDLLEEMDDLEKLVKTVDQKKYGDLFQKRFLLARKADEYEKQI